jgi:Zn-dependent protease with chaperone function
MSNVAIQSLLVALGGLVLLTGVFLLARRGLLSLRYALGWMAVSLLVIVAALVLVLIGGISHSLPLTPTGLLASVGLGFLLVISLQLSISLSGQREAIRELSEANALLGERLRRIEDHVRDREQKQGDNTEPPSSVRSSQGGSSPGSG